MGMARLVHYWIRGANAQTQAIRKASVSRRRPALAQHRFATTQGDPMGSTGRIAGIACVLMATSGCATLREYAAGSLGDALAGGGDVYASDDDVELVGAATPFGLKTIESLLAAAPKHGGLLLAATQGFTQYAYVYVQLPAEDAEERDVAYAYAQLERARRLYIRARDYGLRGLESAPNDVALLYWTG